MIEEFQLTDGISLSVGPVALADALALGVMVLVLALILPRALPGLRRGTDRESLWPALPPLLEKLGLSALPRPLAWAGAGLWTLLFAALVLGLLWVLGRLFFLGPAEITAADGNLRWYLLTLTALTAALGAVISLPFTLIRTGFNARQTLATEEGLVTDRINAAVESLGAVKEVNRLGRNLTYIHDGLRKRGFEWNDDRFSLPDDDAESSIPDDDPGGEWKNIALTEPNLEVRIGAILALERIAQKNADVHVQVMQILCAYIRENAKAADALPPPELPAYPEIGPEDDAEEAWAEWRFEVSSRMRAVRERLAPPRTDIQTALDVLGRRKAEQRRIEAAWKTEAEKADNVFDAPYPGASYPEPWSPEAHARWAQAFGAELDACNAAYRDYAGYRLDLRGTNLQGYNMAGGCWRGARFESARMQGANLRGAQMQGAELWDARMQGAVLMDARMQGALLRAARMQGAELWGAQMQGAGLPGAQMQGAALWGAQMQGADLRDAQMQGAGLPGAQMQGAALWGARMQGALLGDAQMQGARLRGARMQGAGLGDARMQGADLRDAQMQGAGLRGAQMQGARLGSAQMQAVYLVGTKFDSATDFRPATMHGAALRSVDISNLRIRRALFRTTFGDASVRLPKDMEPPSDWEFKVKLDEETFLARWTAFRATLPDRD